MYAYPVSHLTAQKLQLSVCVYREQLDVCVEILGRVLEVLDPTHLARSCKVELQSGLDHPDNSVKVLTLTQVGSMSRPVPCVHLMCYVNCFPEPVCVFVDKAGARQCRWDWRVDEQS